MKFDVLFDRESVSKDIHYGWGLSFLINRRILFDTGEKSEYIIENAQKMGIDLNKAVEKIVISHEHWDHTGGLWKLNLKNKPVYICNSSSDNFKERLSKTGCEMIEVNRINEIEEGIYSSGELLAKYKERTLAEQSLIMSNDKGLVVFCGCAHPNVVNIAEHIKGDFSDRKIHLIIGGFHLLSQDMRMVNLMAERLKSLEVGKIAPSHCTGPEAEEIFRSAYRENFIKIQAGKTIQI